MAQICELVKPPLLCPFLAMYQNRVIGASLRSMLCAKVLLRLKDFGGASWAG